MATTVGDTLASSKLAVAQGDLHLVDPSVDKLIVQFDQAAYDEFLAAYQIKVDKAKRRHYKARAAASRLASATPSSSAIPALMVKRSIPSSGDGSSRAPAQSRIYH